MLIGNLIVGFLEGPTTPIQPSNHRENIQRKGRKKKEREKKEWKGRVATGRAHSGNIVKEGYKCNHLTDKNKQRS